MTERQRAYGAWIVVCLVWGTTYLGIRIALETLSPFLMAGARWTAAGGLLIALFAARGEALPPRSDWPSLALLGVLLVGFGNGAVVWAELTVPTGLTSVLVAMAPFWIVGVDALWPDGERIGLRRVLGLIVGFTGIVLLVGPQLRLADGRQFLGGVVSTQLACIGFAIGSAWSRRRSHDENLLVIVAFEMLFGGLAMLLMALTLNETGVTLNARTASALVYLIVFGSIGGFSAYAYALKHMPISTLSLYAYINPIIAVILGVLLLHEPFNIRMILAAVVIFTGVVLVRTAHPASQGEL